MIGNEPPLRLDAPREEVLEHAVKLVADAWQSFDRYRPEEPPLDERVRRLLETELPPGPASAHEAVDDAGHRAGGQSRLAGQLAGGHLPEPLDDVEAPKPGRVHPEARRRRLVEHLVQVLVDAELVTELAR